MYSWKTKAHFQSSSYLKGSFTNQAGRENNQIPRVSQSIDIIKCKPETNPKIELSTQYKTETNPKVETSTLFKTDTNPRMEINRYLKTLNNQKDQTTSPCSKSRSSFMRSRVINRQSLIPDNRRSFNLERGRQMADDKASDYNQNSVISQLHEQIVKSITHMPKEIVNFLNINHHHQESKQLCEPKDYENQVSRLLYEWEYELIQSLQGIEETIVSRLFKGNYYDPSKDSIGKMFTLNSDLIDPQENFDIKMIPKILLALNGTMSKGIKLFSLTKPILATAVENIWKLFTFILDLTISWANNRNNTYIQRETKESENNLVEAKLIIGHLEDKIVQLMKKSSKELQQERAKYFELNEQCQILSVKIHELSRGKDEEIQYIANGGVLLMNQRISELDFTLKQFDKEVNQSAFKIQSGITGIANSLMVHSNVAMRVSFQLRNILGVNPKVQLPGDLAFGNMISEHPWMPILQLRNLSQLTYKYKEQEQPSKQAILHDFLMQTMDKEISATQKIIQSSQDSSFSHMLQGVLNIVLPSPDKSPQIIYINQILQRVFNIQDKEGLEAHYFVKLQQYYQTMVKIIINQSKNSQLKRSQSIPPDFGQPGSIFSQKFTIDQIKNYMIIIQQVINNDKDFIMIQSVFLEYTQNELQFIQVLQILTECLYKMSQQNYKNRVTLFQTKLTFLVNQEDIFKKSVAQVICNDIYSEYTQIDVVKVWFYLINRYYVVFEKQILYDSSIASRKILELEQEFIRKPFINSGIPTENIIDQFMVQTLFRIRTMLIFNPKIFDKQIQHLQDDSGQSTPIQQSYLQSKIDIVSSQRLSLIVKPNIDKTHSHYEMAKK